MESLRLNTGVKEYAINDETGKALGVLRCNPADPNLGVRHKALEDTVAALSEKYGDLLKDKPTGDDSDFWAAVNAIDTQIKEKLDYAFGLGNDFDQLFAGMHVMSLGNNGQPIIFNFMEMVAPVITSGVKERMTAKVAEAKVAQAANRAQRRASK